MVACELEGSLVLGASVPGGDVILFKSAGVETRRTAGDAVVGMSVADDIGGVLLLVKMTISHEVVELGGNRSNAKSSSRTRLRRGREMAVAC